MTNAKARTTTIATTTTAQDTVARNTAYASATVGILVSLWAGACFVSALITAGPIGMVNNWFSAIAGF